MNSGMNSDGYNATRKTMADKIAMAVAAITAIRRRRRPRGFGEGGFSAEVIMFCSWSDTVSLFVDSNSSKSSEKPGQ
jgi:hypothetical protein